MKITCPFPECKTYAELLYPNDRGALLALGWWVNAGAWLCGEHPKPAFLDGVSLMNKCKHCGEDIKITIYRGLGYCCENHRKILNGEANAPQL